MHLINRREAVGTLVKGSLTAALVEVARGGRLMAGDIQEGRGGAGELPPAYRGEHEVQPLPFKPDSLRGISERLITSHHDNNYAGAVRRLNQIQQQIGQLPEDVAPYQWGSLKREELIATNSMILHEFYFGNLGGDGKPGGTVVDLINAHYGSYDVWLHDFRLTGMSLAGGSGWVIMNFDPHEGAVHNYWAWDHTHNLAWGMPVLVMDMYEHAYHIDYGANATGYIDAFFLNVNWDEVNARVENVCMRK